MKIRYTLLFFALALAAGSPGAAQESGQPTGFPYKIIHHDLSIELDLDTHSLVATDVMKLKREIKKPPDFNFLLRKGLQVRSVQINRQDVIFTVEPDVAPTLFETKVDSEDTAYYGRAELVRVQIPEELNKKKTLSLAVVYDGVVQDSVTGGDFSREYITEQITGIISREGVYLGGEAIYYPSLPDQLFTFRLTVTVPDPFQTVSEGYLDASLAQDGSLRETWVSEHPMDGFHIIAGQYQVGSVDYRGVRISTYFFPEEADLSSRYLEACKGYLDLYDDLLGPYPFRKFAVVDNFFSSGYGMPSFTLLGSQVLRLPFIIYTSLGHEICHNWWGNSVYVDYESGNWCEGLTTYCADYLYKERKSLDDAREYRVGILRDYTAYTHQGNDFPLREFRERHNPAQRAVGYGKSAMLFHMVRNYLGDEDFWRSLRRFYRDNIWTLASWEDLRKAFEKESALKLGWFFDQWLDRTGAPQLEIRDPSKEESEGTWEITFTLVQTQDGEAYNLDVPILVGGEGQTAHLQAGMNQKEQEITLRTIFEPTFFTVDPDFEIFRRLAPTEVAPTLAELLGEPRITAVLPGLTSSETQDVYKAFAKDLLPPNAGQINILPDYEFYLDEKTDKSVLFFGKPSENQAFPSAWLGGDRWRLGAESFSVAGEEYPVAGHTVVLVGRDPDNPQRTYGIIATGSVEDLIKISGKLRHYGKYSYLVFRGTTNIAKGNWDVTDSPMTYRF